MKKLIQIINESFENKISNFIKKEKNSNFINFINYLKNNINDWEEISDLSDNMYNFSKEQILSYLKDDLRNNPKFLLNNGLCNDFSEYIKKSLNNLKLKIVGDKSIHTGVLFNNNVYDYNYSDGINSDNCILKAKIAIEFCKQNNYKYRFLLNGKLIENLSYI